MKAFLACRPDDKALVVTQIVSNLLKEKDIEVVSDVEASDVIFTIGGDGTLIYYVNKYLALNKPFVGVNAGSVGYHCFVKKEDIEQGLEEFLQVSKPFCFGAFEVTYRGKTLFAVQDLRIERPTERSITLKAVNYKEVIALRHNGDGIIIANALGSTAYNASAGGITLSLGTIGAVITPICPYRDGKVYDSLSESRIFSSLKLEVVSEYSARLVLDNRPYELESKEPVKILYGTKTFKVFLRG